MVVSFQECWARTHWLVVALFRFLLLTVLRTAWIAVALALGFCICFVSLQDCASRMLWSASFSCVSSRFCSAYHFHWTVPAEQTTLEGKSL